MSIIILALTIYGEARGETIQGMIAVGCVIRNRLKKISYPTTYKKVCLKPKQFSCWNKDDPNSTLLWKLEENFKNEIKINKILNQCYFIAKGIYYDIILDNTKGADHYLTYDLYKKKQLEGKGHWSTKLVQTVRIDHHIFLK